MRVASPTLVPMCSPTRPRLSTEWETRAPRNQATVKRAQQARRSLAEAATASFLLRTRPAFPLALTCLDAGAERRRRRRNVAIIAVGLAAVPRKCSLELARGTSQRGADAWRAYLPASAVNTRSGRCQMRCCEMRIFAMDVPKKTGCAEDS